MSDEDDNIKILKHRYAKGEISKKEYNQMREDLGLREKTPDTKPLNEVKKVTVQKQQVNESFVEKNRNLLIVGGVAVIIIAYIVYSWMASTPSSIRVISAPYSVFGNNTAISIPVVVYSSVGTRINSGEVNVQTNVGSAQPCVIANGNCDITFTPGVQTNPVTADIEFSDGGVVQQITINIEALASLSVSSGSTQLYNNNIASTSFPAGIFANPSSTVSLTVTAYDNNNKPVTGQRVNFSIETSGSYAESGGSMSNNYCITQGGSCSVTFDPSTTPGNLSIIISAGNVNLVVPVLSISSGYNITFNPSTYSVQTGSDITLSGKVLYSSNLQSASDVGIQFYSVDTTSICAMGGGFCITEGQSLNPIGNCNSNGQGECSIIYTAPNSGGNVDIAAGVFPWPGTGGRYAGMRFGTDNDDNGDCGNFNCPSYVLNGGQQASVSYPTYTSYDTISVT